MKKIFFTFILALMAMTASAVPAKRGLTQQLTLADGTTVTARLVGDEFGHFWLADDGTTYQKVMGSNVFQSFNAEELKQRADQRRAQANQDRKSRMNAQRRVGTFGNYIGAKKGLVILVNFKDKSFASGHNNALYQNICNTPNYTQNGFSGSIYDYFLDQSNGQFQLTFDVAGPVTVSQNMSYYGGNDWWGDDQHPAEMVREAVQLVNSDVDFSQYDWDGDGYVDQVYVIYAGQGEANGGSSDTIWPHAWSLSSGATSITLDGKTIDTYACGAELQGYSQISGIGTMCHEFSHCLGFPDFYDTDYSGGVGMDDWDLMCGGSYNGNEFVPAGYTSYERWMAGWLTPIELKNTRSVTNMKGLQEGGESYIIYNDGHPDEYYMLENRKNVKWDRYLPGEGLLIVHVDYDESIWASNKPNDVPSHQRMIWIPANNNLNSPSGGTYPYGSNNTFNSTSSPSSAFYNNTSNGTKYPDWWSVEEITKNSSNKYISFYFRGLSNVKTPVFNLEAGIYSEAQQIQITTETEDAVIYYTTDGSIPTTQSTQYNGPFTLNETTTVNAIAIKGEDVSEMSSVRYVFHIPGTGTVFTKVLKRSNLKPGRKFLLVNEDAAKVLDGISDTSTPYGLPNDVELDVTSKEATIYNGEASVLTLGGEQGAWTFQMDDNSYLSWTSGNSLMTSEEPLEWTVVVDENGAVMKTSSRTIQYNSTSPRFACYSSTMKKAYLYVEKTDDLIGEKDDVIMSFQPDAITLELGMEFTAPTFKSTPSALTVTYTSSNPEVAEVNEETGEVNILGLGETTITATFAGNEDYNEGSASYTLTVIEPVVGTGRYQLVKSYDELVSGKNYLIVSTKADGSYVAWNGLNTSGSSGNVGNVNVVDDVIDMSVVGNKAVSVVLECDQSSSTTTWSIKEGETYIKGVSTNKLGATNDPSATAAKWTLSVSDSYVASLKNRNSNNYLKYNPQADMFRVYAASGQRAIYLFKEIEETVIPGDVNGDGSVDVADFTMMANYLLEKNPEGFILAAADVTGGDEGKPDGEIDIADLTGIANIILHGVNTAANAPKQVAAENTDTEDNAIYVEPATAIHGTQQVLSVRMKNNVEVSGMEFTLQLPEGITVATNADGLIMAEFTGKTDFSGSKLLSDGSLKMLCASMSVNPSTGRLFSFDGMDGEVARIIVNIPADYLLGMYEVSFLNAKTSNPDGKKTLLANMGGNINVVSETTGISDSQFTTDDSQSDTWYTLDGRKLLNKPTQKGVYIVNGKKQVVK